MLRKLSEKSRACHDRAAEARRKAEATADSAWKAEFLDMEERWLALARSYEFTERLGDFAAENSRRLRKLDENAQSNATRRDTPQRHDIGGLLDRVRSSLQLSLFGRRALDPVEHRSVEAALREAETWLASIVEFSDEAIISKDLDGIISSWNKGAERVYGYTAEEVVGRSATILVPPNRHDEGPAILDRVRRGERIDNYETVCQRKDGSLITISLTVSPIKDAQGKIIGASKISRDITERKRNEELIATLAREAEHRTKNVLAIVQAAVRLSQADTPEALKQAIEGRIEALAKVHTLFARSGWAGAELSALAAQELAPYLQPDEARARIDGPKVLLAPAVAQAVAMTLHELATNAAKYGALSAAKGHVEVKWSLATDGRLALNWMEIGGPPPITPERQGFGTRVIEQMIVGQLKGTVRPDWRADGLTCEIAFPFSTEHGS